MNDASWNFTFGCGAAQRADSNEQKKNIEKEKSEEYTADTN